MVGAALQDVKLALVLPKLSLSRAQRRRVLSCTAILALFPTLPAPAWGQIRTSEPPDSPEAEPWTLSGAVSGSRHTAEMAVHAPELPGAFLSLAMPGAGQLYAGDPVRAAVYFGAAILVGASTYNLLRAGVSDFEAREARTQAFMGVIAYGTSFGVGIVSTLDAMADITGRYMAANEALVPPAGADLRPRPAAPRRKGDDE